MLNLAFRSSRNVQTFCLNFKKNSLLRADLSLLLDMDCLDILCCLSLLLDRDIQSCLMSELDSQALRFLTYLMSELDSYTWRCMICFLLFCSSMFIERMNIEQSARRYRKNNETSEESILPLDPICIVLKCKCTRWFYYGSSCSIKMFDYRVNSFQPCQYCFRLSLKTHHLAVNDIKSVIGYIQQKFPIA